MQLNLIFHCLLFSFGERNISTVEIPAEASCMRHGKKASEGALARQSAAESAGKNANAPRDERFGGEASRDHVDVIRSENGRFVSEVRLSRRDVSEVIVRDFHPQRGVAVLEFNRQRVRYTKEKSAEQVYAMADYLRARRGFATDQQMAEVLGVHRSRLIAWKQGTELPNTPNSQLLSHLAVVVQELEVFLDPDVIPDWLLTEQYMLAGRTPVDALRAGQLAEVLQTANATEHGAYI
jgi:transcriptional regulator with XRE-family HTH domain